MEEISICIIFTTFTTSILATCYLLFLNPHLSKKHPLNIKALLCYFLFDNRF